MSEILVRVKTIENGYLVALGEKQEYSTSYMWKRETYVKELGFVGNQVVKQLEDRANEIAKAKQEKEAKKSTKEKKV